MKTRLFALIVLLGLVLPWPRAAAQIAPKTLDLVEEFRPNGSVDFTVLMSFDAAAWKQWRTQVGDEPARLRGLMRHQFSAYVIDDFKFEKDDLNRTAKVTMHSPAGPQLLTDGRFRVAVEPEFRLVNHTGREWFLSGNNPYAGNSLNTVKIVLPENTVEASLANAGSADQALVYSLKVPAGRSGIFGWSGVVVLLAGVALFAAGLAAKRPPAPAAVPPPA